MAISGFCVLVQAYCVLRLQACVDTVWEASFVLLFRKARGLKFLTQFGGFWLVCVMWF